LPFLKGVTRSKNNHTNRNPISFNILIPCSASSSLNKIKSFENVDTIDIFIPFSAISAEILASRYSG